MGFGDILKSMRQSAQSSPNTATRSRAFLLLALAFFLTGLAHMSLRNALALDVSGTAVANNALARFLVWLLELTILAIYLQRSATRTARKGLARILALLLVNALGLTAFIIVVASPLLHLAIIMRLQAWGVWLLFALTFLPLFLWFTSYLLRMMLAIPAWARGEPQTLRGALHQSDDDYSTLIRLEILILAFALIARAIEDAIATIDTTSQALLGAIMHGIIYAAGAVLIALTLQTMEKIWARPQNRDHVLA